jgi:imidazolonepropionase-like amidohydrolase
VLLSHQTVVEPTLARSEFNGHPRRQSFSAIEPSVALLPPELAIILNNAGVTEDREARATAGLQAALDTAGLLHQAGVPILAGTDQVVPGFSIGRELELLVRAGLSPVEAIRSATSVPGKVFGVASSGVVRVGGRADLIVIDGNPIANISDIRRVSLTIAAGRAYDPADLRRAASFR